MSHPVGAAPAEGTRRVGRRRGAGPWALALAAAAGVGLAGCSSGPSASNRTTTTAASATTTTTRSSTTTTAVPPRSSTTTTVALAACRAAQLTMAPGQSNGAAGTIEIDVTMQNTSMAKCSMFGYPGMQLLAANGTALPTDVVRGGGPAFPVPAANGTPAPFTLSPGSSAAFFLSYEDVPVGTETSCPTSAQARVTPPNAFDNAVVALMIAPCGGGTVHVSPVYPLG